MYVVHFVRPRCEFSMCVHTVLTHYKCVHVRYHYCVHIKNSLMIMTNVASVYTGLVGPLFLAFCSLHLGTTFYTPVFFISYPVNCLEVSRSGLYMATGEKGQLGVRAKVILWDTTSWTQVYIYFT